MTIKDIHNKIFSYIPTEFHSYMYPCISSDNRNIQSIDEYEQPIGHLSYLYKSKTEILNKVSIFLEENYFYIGVKEYPIHSIPDNVFLNIALMIACELNSKLIYLGFLGNKECESFLNSNVRKYNINNILK